MEKLNLKRHSILKFVDPKPGGIMHIKDIRRGTKTHPDRHNATLCGITVKYHRTEQAWNLEAICKSCKAQLLAEYPDDWYSIEDSEG